MKVVIQRVSSASVTISENIVAQIDNGLLVLVGIEDDDSQEDINWLSQKIINLRIFADDNGVMNLSVKDIEGELNNEPSNNYTSRISAVYCGP